MATKFVSGIEFSTENCAACGMVFAMTADFMRRRRKDGNSFYCPAGHTLHYDPVNPERDLKRQLEQANQKLSMEVVRANMLAHQRDELRRQQKRLRDRIKNGVCPCCNRSFGNLRDHMRTQHPEYGSRETFGQVLDVLCLTKADAAREIGISPASVTNYMVGRAGSQVTNRIERWLEEQLGE